MRIGDFKMKLDLHIHTTASDGQYTPGQVVEMCKELDLAYMAITDHDTVSGLEEGAERAAQLGIPFIPGIEISTQDSEEIHILGYYIDRENEALVKACREFEQSRSERGERICAFFHKKGIPLDLDEVREYAGEGSLGRPHFARWLLEHGYVKDRKYAFYRYLDTKDFHRETDRVKPSPIEAIELIHRAGGKAVLAHPGLLKMDYVRQVQLIKTLKANGLDGIEAIYRRHNDRQRAKYMALAEELQLKISCGSDFHGEKVKPDVKLGMEIAEADVEMVVILQSTYQ
jgi:predicted metal-dependent phosphoesterase TrpH